MPFDYYRIFYYVAKYKSFSKAAKFLHNNQPNITRCMNIMESELGCTLFIRSHRGIKLTPEGEIWNCYDRSKRNCTSFIFVAEIREVSQTLSTY